MLVKADAAQLEWRVKAFLSQDPVAIGEIVRGEDIHSNNQEEFKLPTRLISKVFAFRIIFSDCFGEQGLRGPAYAYANDPDFASVSTSVKFWEKVIEKFFQKYQGIYNHSLYLIREMTQEGIIVSPSGRFYRFSPKVNRYGVPDWPRTEALNYPIQGLSADFMMLVRLLLRSQLQVYTYKLSVLPINTVHDDQELDVVNDPKIVFEVCQMLEDCFSRIPERFEKLFGVPVNVPFSSETKFGLNLSEKSMFKFNPLSFQEDYSKIMLDKR